jgi:hypothetical protein
MIRSHMIRCRGDERGQAVVLLLILATAMFVASSAALVVLGGRASDRTRAQTAADAAALASLDGGLEAAQRLAGRHGGAVVRWHRGPGVDTVTVIVKVGDSLATATATDSP